MAQFKAKLLINQIARNVYRDTLGGVYNGANLVIERCGNGAAHVEIFEKHGKDYWKRIDKQDVEAGSLLRC